MKAFIIVMLVLRGLDIIYRLLCLGEGNYPRRREELVAWVDVICLIVGVAIFIWGWSLI